MIQCEDGEICIELFEESLRSLGYDDMVININGEDLGPGDLQSIIHVSDIEEILKLKQGSCLVECINEIIKDLSDFKS